MTTPSKPPSPFSPGAAVGIDERVIRQLVDRFYDRIRRDRKLGPIFETAIGPVWDLHLETMMDFWSSVVLMSGRYHGKPVEVHQRLTALKPAHYKRWLELFDTVAREVCDEKAAGFFIDRAWRIAHSLEPKLARAVPDGGAGPVS